MDSFLASQLEYYRARALEYDEWFLRHGRYDRGEEWNRRWLAEVDEIQHVVDALGRCENVLELASGTGVWTERLARLGINLTVIDAAPEMLAICRARLVKAGVDLAQVRFMREDLFAWEPEPAVYDLVFMSFWLSHVPPERIDRFLGKVASVLKPGGRVFILDSRRSPESTADDHVLPAEHETYAVRKLNDGREFTILKLFYDPDTLAGLLRDVGLIPQVRVTDNFFITAIAEKPGL